ncbi:hypothetical protein Peur_025673 [Populus x canadensis]
MYTTLHALYSGCSALSLRLFAISQSVPKWGKDLGTRTETNLIHQEKDGTVNTFSNPIVSVLCPECQGTGVNIEGDELEKTPASHSEVFQFQMNVCNGYKGWMKSPEILEKCSTGFDFPPESGEPVQARPLPHMNVSGFQARNSSLEAALRTLSAMLPKGAPLPPSGPSPGIN